MTLTGASLVPRRQRPALGFKLLWAVFLPAILQRKVFKSQSNQSIEMCHKCRNIPGFSWAAALHTDSPPPSSSTAHREVEGTGRWTFCETPHSRHHSSSKDLLLLLNLFQNQGSREIYQKKEDFIYTDELFIACALRSSAPDASVCITEHATSGTHWAPWQDKPAR